MCLPEAIAPDLALLEMSACSSHYPCPPPDTSDHLSPVLNGLPNLPDSETSLTIMLVFEVELELQAQCCRLPLVLLVTGR